MSIGDGEQTASTDSLLSETERRVAEVWREVLQLSSLPSPSDHFFDLGGDSMTMVVAEYRLREEFCVALSAEAIINSQSLRELSSIIESAESTVG